MKDRSKTGLYDLIWDQEMDNSKKTPLAIKAKGV